MTIEELRKSGWIAFEYIRGSHAYGLNTETSDVDMGGVFILPNDYLMGLRSHYIEQVSDDKNDTVYYEINGHLTQRERFKLQGFNPNYVDLLLKNGISKGYIDKMSGNSITVNVIQAILKNLLLSYEYI